MMSKTTQLARYVAFFSLSILLATPATARTPEQVFADAEGWTVRIQTRIERALGNDEAGVFSGTGFIVDSEKGWIVTNRHVVGESPSDVRASLKDSSYETAKKIYVDSFADIAVIQVDLGTNVEAPLACEEMPGTGHPVGAYGHPWGLEYTGTQGVISGRTDKFGTDLLQTDSPINSGNSGGALISMRSGHVVGINTSSYNEEDAENTNFAVPITEVCRIIQLLADGNDPSPPRLPVAFYELKDQQQLVVARSYIHSEQLDLRRGDRVVSAGRVRTAVTERHQLINALRGELDDVILEVKRDDKTIEVRGSLTPQMTRRGVVFAGMVIAERNYLDGGLLPVGHDINVHSFVQGSVGEAEGLEWYDFIISVDGHTVETIEGLFALLQQTEAGEPVTLEFVRMWEPPFFFEYVEREVVADTPLWLGEYGYQGGIRARLLWELDNVARYSQFDAGARSATIENIQALVALSNDPDAESHPKVLADINQIGNRLVNALEELARQDINTIAENDSRD